MEALQLIVIFAAMVGIFAFVVRGYGLWSVPSFVAVMFVVGFGLRSFVAASTLGFKAFGFTMDPNDILICDSMGLAGMVAFGVGLLLHQRFSRSKPKEVVRPDLIHPRKAEAIWFWVQAAAVAALLLQAALLTYLYGGLTHAFVALSQRSIVNVRAAGSLANFANEWSQVTVPLVLAAVFYAARSRSKARLLFSLAILLALVPWTSVLNGRAQFVVVAWAGLMMGDRMLNWRPGPVVLASLSGLIAVMVLLVSAQRLSSQIHIPFDVALGLAVPHALELISGALPMLDALHVARIYIHMAGHSLFGIILPALTVMVPHDIWPGKPMTAPLMVNRVVLHSVLSGLPVGLVGEGLIAMGLVGVAALPLIVGGLASKFDAVIGRWKGGDLLRCWLIFEVIYTGMNGVRVGFQGLMINAQLALVYGVACWVAQQIVYAQLFDRRGAAVANQILANRRHLHAAE